MLRVTEAIKRCGLIDATWFNETATARGTAVHLATALDDAGTLDESSVHEAVRPYLESWRRLRAEAGFGIIAAEQEVKHPGMNYVGHFDRVIDCRSYPCVLDIKCGAPQKWHAIQTALYALAWQAMHGGATPRRFSAYLHDDGRAGTLVEYKDRGDFEVAKAVITLAHWKGEQ